VKRFASETKSDYLEHRRVRVVVEMMFKFNTHVILQWDNGWRVIARLVQNQILVLGSCTVLLVDRITTRPNVIIH